MFLPTKHLIPMPQKILRGIYQLKTNTNFAYTIKFKETEILRISIYSPDKSTL